MPAIEDPNNDITLWESGAIVQVRVASVSVLQGKIHSQFWDQYLIETYDKEHKISYNSFPEKYLTQQ